MARREGLVNDDELGPARTATRVLLATIDEGPRNSPHHIALKPRITLEAPRAFLFSLNQYLCGMARPSTSQVVHDVQIANASGKMVTVMALIDCGATSIFI